MRSEVRNCRRKGFVLRDFFWLVEGVESEKVHSVRQTTPAIGIQRIWPSLCHSPVPGGNLEGVDDVRVLPVRVEGMAMDRGPDRAVDLNFNNKDEKSGMTSCNPNDTTSTRAPSTASGHNPQRTSPD